MTGQNDDRGFWIIDDDPVKIIETNYPSEIVEGSQEFEFFYKAG